METLEHELFVVVKVCESRDGDRTAEVVEVFEGDCEGEAMMEAGRHFGARTIAAGDPEWRTRGYVQRLLIRLPILGTPTPTISLDGKLVARRSRLKVHSPSNA